MINDRSKRHPLTRRDVLRLGAAGGAGLAIAACGGASVATPATAVPAAPAPAATVATANPLEALEKAAKAEGTLTWYTAVPPPAVTPLVKAFTDKYGIKVEVNRQTSGALGTLLKTESESGKVIVDVIEMGDVVGMQGAADKGWLLKPTVTEVPALKEWPAKWAYQGATFPQAVAVYTIAYNTQLVKDADVPKDWSALNNPKFKGKIMLGDPRASTQLLDFINNLYKQYGAAFVRSLGAQNPQWTASTPTGLNSVASGDVAMLAPGARWIMTDLLDKGAPLADTNPLPAMSGSEQWAGLVKGGPHPNAGKLFFNFILSADGQAGTCGKSLCSSVLNTTGTAPFPTTYASPNLVEAVAKRTEILGLLGIQ